MALLILLGFASWPLTAFINSRFRRRSPVPIAIREAAFWLLASLCVGIALIDAYSAIHAREPAANLTHLLLFFTALWFSLPSIGFCAWLVRRRFCRPAANPNNA